MLSRHIALVSEVREVHAAELAVVAAAIQQQVTRDFGPIWNVHAAIAAYDRLENVPLGDWPVIIKDDLDRPEAAGYHEDELGQPCALVRFTDDWSVTTSHETLEMLADPYGRHLVASQSPLHPDEQVRFLVEVCDPCSNESYKIDGIEVSDFYTPQFFNLTAMPSARYSFTGAITAPRQVLKGGYLTWHDSTTRKWWHRAWFDGNTPKDTEIPIPAIVKGNIRAAVDRHVRAHRIARS